MRLLAVALLVLGAGFAFADGEERPVQFAKTPDALRAKFKELERLAYKSQDSFPHRGDSSYRPCVVERPTSDELRERIEAFIKLRLELSKSKLSEWGVERPEDIYKAIPKDQILKSLARIKELGAKKLALHNNYSALLRVSETNQETMVLMDAEMEKASQVYDRLALEICKERDEIAVKMSLSATLSALSRTTPN